MLGNQLIKTPKSPPPKNSGEGFTPNTFTLAMQRYAKKYKNHKFYTIFFNIFPIF